jgi:hypothetical protein
MKDNKEIRLAASELSVRSGGNVEGAGTLTGYAVKFNDVTTIGGQFEERVSETAFEGVDMSNTFALWNHDWNEPLGRSGRNLNLTVDSTGIAVNLDLPNTSRGRDLAELVRAGVVGGMSFGFTVADDTWEQRDGLPLRTIDSVGELFEVTFTPIPAYPTTEVAMRSLEANTETVPEAAPEAAPEATPETVEPEAVSPPKFTAAEILEAAPEGKLEPFLKKIVEKFG